MSQAVKTHRLKCFFFMKIYCSVPNFMRIHGVYSIDTKSTLLEFELVGVIENATRSTSTARQPVFVRVTNLR